MPADALESYRHAVAALKQARWTHWPARALALLATVPGLLHEVRGWKPLTVRVASDRDGREVRRGLAERTSMGPVNAIGAGVLTLPDSPQEYLRGRRRQAVRTMRTRADALGITCRQPSWHETARIAEEVLVTREERDAVYGPWIADRVDRRSGEFWVAENEAGDALALTVVVVSGEVAWLSWMMSAASEHSSEARFALSSTVNMWLVSRGVRHVLTDTVLSMPPGLVYFQRRLGFEPRRVRVLPLLPTPSEARRRIPRQRRSR